MGPGASDPFQIVGTTIAEKYRVDGVLGEGGYGVVYAGFHLLLETPVAVKLLKPVSGAYAGEQAATQQFLREARVLFSLSHPAIVRMYDVGELTTRLGSVPYVVLERLDGIGFDAELARRKAAGDRGLGPREMLGALEPVLEALAFAHRHGVVHRDMKPSNIMLVGGGAGEPTAKVLDFGTARASAQEFSMGTTGFTPRYASPEQWDPSFGTTGPASDLFTMGLIIVEAATLEPAFPGSSPAQVLAAAVNPNHVLRVRDRRPDLPEALDHVIARATARRVHERFASADEMLEALRGALRNAPSVTTSGAHAPVYGGASYPQGPAPQGAPYAPMPPAPPSPYAPIERTGGPMWTQARPAPPPRGSSPWVVPAVVGGGALLLLASMTGALLVRRPTTVTANGDPTSTSTARGTGGTEATDFSVEARDPRTPSDDEPPSVPARPSADGAHRRHDPDPASSGATPPRTAPGPSATPPTATTSPPASAGVPTIHLTLSRSQVAPGERLQAVFNPPLPAAGDRYWITILPASSADSDWGNWSYLSVGQAFQVVTAPTVPGTYEIRVHDSYPRYTTHVNSRARLVVGAP